MDVAVLGPLVVSDSGTDITPMAPKVRQTLCVLAINAGKPVTMRLLTEELWGESVPGKPAQTVQTYVLMLRRLISAKTARHETAVNLRTCAGGYVLDLDPSSIDTTLFAAQLRVAQSALDRGDIRTADSLLHSTLELWRGPAFVDVPQGVELTTKAHGLTELRLAALDTRIETDLRLGRHRPLLGELAELTVRYPMHEGFGVHFMTALARSGQRWRALEVFTRLRTTLVEELGVEPAGQVQRLHSAILNGDTALDGPLPLPPLVPVRTPQPLRSLTG
jgi:DNA-binding SARP family transcriptional activator